MKSTDLARIGIHDPAARKAAFSTIRKLVKAGTPVVEINDTLQRVAESPENYLEDPDWNPLALKLLESGRDVPRTEPAPWHQWGEDFDEQSVEQMRNACDLPIAVSGALMPDAHPGYGLPIGGVLATDSAVIPYAVGVDIACRMKLSVLDLPCGELDGKSGRSRLARAIEEETRFGIGVEFRKSERREHPVMDADWSVSKITEKNREKAWAQLGTSGSGNHFVEFGKLHVVSSELGLEPGTYLALLSHSGSRGTGATVAGYYSRLAMKRHPHLPPRLRHLAWLDMVSAEGQEYWSAMNLMGEYAAANHFCIHKHIARHLGAAVLLEVENHHNFAWKENHGGREVYVHRKGATPAGAGVLGIIPGSMASPGYVVRGKGNEDSLNSASHGAGRVMSRKRAKENLKWEEARRVLESRRVTLLSAGLDEVPMVYKDIETVMAAQRDLVEKLACFQPRLVKMAPAGERPED